MITIVPDPEVAKGSDEPEFQSIPQPCARLSRSELLSDLLSRLSHLRTVIQDFPSLFGDVPSQTNVLQHDIQVSVNKPLKQQAYQKKLTICWNMI